jgi:multidrug efflux pump subunit AcrA (membrane-fusion protein)
MLQKTAGNYMLVIPVTKICGTLQDITVHARFTFLGQLQIVTLMWDSLSRLMLLNSSDYLRTQKLRIYIGVRQNLAFGVKPGSKGELVIPGLTGKRFEATVVTTADQISDESRTLPVQMEIANDSGQILAGSFGQVKLSIARGNSPVTLPENAVLFGAKGPYIEVVSNDNSVSVREVTPGKNIGGALEILSGVTLNDRVVANPSDWLVGVKVHVVSPKIMKMEQ